MAEVLVYYKIDGDNLYYTNENKSGYAEWNPYQSTGAPAYIALNKNVIVELTNGQFTFQAVSDYMFAYCLNTSFDTTGWDTACSNMKGLFKSCKNLESLDFENLDFTYAKDFSEMFSGCKKLQRIHFDEKFGKVGTVATSFKYAFADCFALTDLNIDMISTERATNLSYMFAQCSLTSLDLSDWDVSKVKDMSYMFYNCPNLEELHIENWTGSGVYALNKTDQMFANCTNVQAIWSSRWLDWLRKPPFPPLIDSSTNMFYNCTKLPNFDSTALDHNKATNSPGGYFSVRPIYRKMRIFMKQ